MMELVANKLMISVVPRRVGVQVRVHGLRGKDMVDEPALVRESTSTMKIGIDPRVVDVYFVANG